MSRQPSKSRLRYTPCNKFSTPAAKAPTNCRISYCGCELLGAFDDIDGLALQCRFRNCRHDTEPDCAVCSAVARGELDAARLSDYIKQARGH
jgi:hypothetical protein